MTDMFKPLPGAKDGSANRASEQDPWRVIVPVPDAARAAPVEHPKRGAPSVTWTYRDAEGRLLGYVMRFDQPAGKEFLPLTLYKNADSGVEEWRWRSWPPPRPLYGLDRLARRPVAPVLVCEGEKAADAAAKLLPDYVAVTSPNGALGAGKADWSPLARRRVVIWPDADQPGRKYADAAARALAGVAGSIDVVEPPPGVASGWDAADALDEGWDQERLEAFMDARARSRPTIATDSKVVKLDKDLSKRASKVSARSVMLHGRIGPPDEPPPAAFKRETDLWCARQHYSDIGNATRFIMRHGCDFRWNKSHGWYGWDGRRWSAEHGAIALRLAVQDTARAMLDEAKTLAAMGTLVGESEGDYEKRISLAYDWFDQSSDVRRSAAMAEMAEPQLGHAVADFDADDFVFNVANGTIRLGRLNDDGDVDFAFGPHERADFLTKLAPAAYDAEATCPRWRAFLDLVLPDKSVQVFLQTYFGYCLTGSQEEQMLVLLHGGGGNGKSTLVETVGDVMGEYSQFIPIQSLLESKHSRDGSAATPDIARLLGARLVRSAEPKRRAALDWALIKLMTGGEPLTARHLNKEFFEFTPKLKLVLSFNTKPANVGTDDGTWRRINLVPFTVQIAKNQRDKAFRAKLKAEWSGILNWMLDGYRMWRERGLVAPPAVLAATAAWREESDKVGPFLATACTVTGNDQDKVKADVLYEAFRAWCRRSALDPSSQTTFGAQMVEQKGVKRMRGGTGIRYHGLIISDATLLAPAKDVPAGQEPPADGDNR